jgi:predicted aminopeptidase
VALLCKDDNNYSWRLLVQRGFSRLEVSVFPGSQLSFGLVLMCFLLIVVFFSCSYCGWVPWFLVLFSG